MKRFLQFLFPLVFVSVVSAQYAPTPVLYPLTATPGIYVDANFHSVPYALAAPNSGLTTVIFDPSTSTTDQIHCFNHLQKDVAVSGTSGQVLQFQILPNVVNLNVNQQEVRTVVPFVVANSTTLQTIPWSFPINVQTNGHYRFFANLYVNTGSGGSKIDVGGTCSTSNFVAAYKCFAATTILYGGQLTSFLSGPSGSNTATGTKIEIDGEMDVTNGGTFVIQFAENTSNATPSVVLAGSTLTLVQVP